MMLEACCHERASFVTLTYNKENIPDGGSLVPRDLQLWLKRFRKAAGECRYFGVGEYGDHSWRPHYHVALFGHGRECQDVVQRTWGLGYTLVGDLTLQSAAYVAGYVNKKMTQKHDPRISETGLHPEFARMSLRPGIGAPAISSLAEAISNKHGWDEIERTGDVPTVLRHSGRDLPLGRFMRGRLRDAIGFKFTQEPASVAYQKTAEVYTLYQNYVLDQASGAAPKTFVQFLNMRDDERVRRMEKKSRIYASVRGSKL